ncbi:hypothetical protein [Arenimonas fontis]|uniref:Uncharacterized protein n=1 Tax=Arenimonas fontis TaxID=2608255 RepID=A0A5B2ZCX7_9GAMM|nr:hypothetical protein [Arenimonas fontis]KAA2285775.1 hypothetical protein F0415_03895 [Arenimonas fontis]
MNAPPNSAGNATTGLLLRLIGLVSAAVLAVGLQASELAKGLPGGNGYRLADNDRSTQCGFAWLDLDRQGHELELVAGHPGAAADDRAAMLRLRRPFELFQTRVDRLVVSGNGYLAAASDFAQDDGSDYGNRCGLPARADNARSSLDRIFVYHDDLRPRPGARVRHAFFEDCPRAGVAGSEACTVIEWDGFERNAPLASSRPLRMQAVLYHRSHAIVMQYASVDDSVGGQATIGLQGLGGRSANRASCDVPGRVADGRALCFFDPRYPPDAAPETATAP